MSYSIGQLRRNQISSYSTPISFTKDLIINKDSIIDFYDPCMILNANGVSSLYSYYLKFEVEQLTDSVQNFTVKLKNSELEEDNIQSIRTLSVKQGQGSTVFELIFTPNNTYNQIIFELRRLALDFNLENENGISGRIMKINILNFYLINNVISNYLTANFNKLKTLKKIGIQGRPGLMFALDGEEMRIGKTGIYELHDDEITISYLGFILNDSTMIPDKKDYFILDFSY